MYGRLLAELRCLLSGIDSKESLIEESINKYTHSVMALSGI